MDESSTGLFGFYSRLIMIHFFLPGCPSDLRNGSAVFWKGGVSGGYEVLLLDEDQGWLLVGGKDHIYLLRPDGLELPPQTVSETNS